MPSPHKFDALKCQDSLLSDTSRETDAPAALRCKLSDHPQACSHLEASRSCTGWSSRRCSWVDNLQEFLFIAHDVILMAQRYAELLEPDLQRWLLARVCLPFDPARSSFRLHEAHVCNSRHNSHRFVHGSLDTVHAVVVDGENSSTQVGACIPEVCECLGLGFYLTHNCCSLLMVQHSKQVPKSSVCLEHLSAQPFVAACNKKVPLYIHVCVCVCVCVCEYIYCYLI